MAFEIERIYHRKRDIHDTFGGQQRGGISTPSDAPYIFLFTGEAGEQHGYQDGFEENGVFIYTGEGQHDDMEFVRGNKAIRDHAGSGRELLLFEATRKKGLYRFKGAFVCAGYDDTQTGPDTDGKLRKLIRFQLVPLATLSSEESLEGGDDSVSEPTAIEIMRQQAYAAGTARATQDAAVSKRSVYKRSLAVKRTSSHGRMGLVSYAKLQPLSERKTAIHIWSHITHGSYPTMDWIHLFGWAQSARHAIDVYTMARMAMS